VELGKCFTWNYGNVLRGTMEMFHVELWKCFTWKYVV